MTTLPTIFVLQDGGRFVCFDEHPDAFDARDGERRQVPTDILEFEDAVQDFDLDGAKKARAWFVARAAEIFPGRPLVFVGA